MKKIGVQSRSAIALSADDTENPRLDRFQARERTVLTLVIRFTGGLSAYDVRRQCVITDRDSFDVIAIRCTSDGAECGENIGQSALTHKVCHLSRKEERGAREFLSASARRAETPLRKLKVPERLMRISSSSNRDRRGPHFRPQLCAAFKLVAFKHSTSLLVPAITQYKNLTWKHVAQGGCPRWRSKPASRPASLHSRCNRRIIESARSLRTHHALSLSLSLSSRLVALAAQLLPPRDFSSPRAPLFPRRPSRRPFIYKRLQLPA